MRNTRTRNTAPEMALRRELHRRGLRYRVNTQPVPGLRTTADVVFPRLRLAVYVDGCFWHSCPEHGNLPKANRPWWKAKLDATMERDQRNQRALEDRGWRVVRVWEHDCPEPGAQVVEALVRKYS